VVPIHLEQSICNGLANQQFMIEPVGSFYKVRARHSGLYFDIAGASFANSAGLVQYPTTGGNNQLFQFIPTR